MSDANCPWTQATPDDVAAVDNNLALSHYIGSDASEYSACYRDAAKGSQVSSAQKNVYAMLSGLMLMYQADDVNNGYGPYFQSADGRRTSDLEDFRDCLSSLEIVAKKNVPPLVSARAAEVVWLLDRSKHGLASFAVRQYIKLLNHICSDPEQIKKESLYIKKIIERLVYISTRKGVQVDGKTQDEIKKFVERCFKLACWQGHAGYIKRFGLLCLRLDLVGIEELARCVESMASINTSSELWSKDMFLFAADQFHDAGNERGYRRCTIRASRSLAQAARNVQQHPMQSANYMAEAISLVSHQPGTRQRRRWLQKELLDIQFDIPVMMDRWRSDPIDLKPYFDDLERRFQGLSFQEIVLALVTFSCSPTPDEMRAEASKEPSLLSLIVPKKSQIDSHGRTISNTDESEATNEIGNFSFTIHSNELIRRESVAWFIRHGLRYIHEHYHVSDYEIGELLKGSPYVPFTYINILKVGIVHFLRGDIRSATLVLTPQLEAILKNLLRNLGEDVTTFDPETREQKEHTLGSLFDRFEGRLVSVMGEGLVADLRNVFLDRPGPSIRNEVAHGLLDDTSFGSNCVYACWLIMHLLLLRVAIDRSKAV